MNDTPIDKDDLSTWADPCGIVPKSEKEKVILIYDLLNHIKRLYALYGRDPESSLTLDIYLDKLKP